MANPWEMNWGGDPVIAPADPYKQAQESRAQQDQSIQATTAGLQNQLTELTIAEKQAKAAEAAEKAQAASQADGNARDKLLRLIGQISSVGLDANDNSGWGETGTTGAMMRGVPGVANAGKDLKGNITTLDANFAFDALQAMRDASKTGGALGSITERELDMLRAAVANLDPNLSHETFLGNLKSVRQAYLAKLAMIDPETATKLGYDSTEAEKAVMSLNEAFNKQMGQDASVEILRETPATTVEPLPGDIAEIMAKYGAN
jgi:hypothetical protein